MKGQRKDVKHAKSATHEHHSSITPFGWLCGAPAFFEHPECESASRVRRQLQWPRISLDFEPSLAVSGGKQYRAAVQDG